MGKKNDVYMKKTKKPELMCPIQNWASLEACKEYADAVYFGVPDFSMRANANAIKASDMLKFVAQCHTYKIKAYLTVNAVVYNHDVKNVSDLIAKAKKAKVDAVIVWDPAAILAAQKLKMPFFISTQANVSNWQTAEFYRKLGAKRVVLAREMSLKQIAEIKKKTKAEVEVFIHGAMCMAISGRCVLSSYLYGTSANCGACAQPCRKQWLLRDPEGNELVTEGKSFLSAKDLCMIEFIPELVKAGIDSFKIEGRRRDPKYIETTSRCYREAIDAYVAGTYTKEKVKQWRAELERVYNRGYSTGFYFSIPGKEGISYDKADNVSLIKRKLVGYVKKYYARMGVAEVVLNHGELHVDDDVIIEGPKTFVEQKIESLEMKHEKIQTGKKGDEVAMLVKGPVREKDHVFILL